MNNLVYMFLSLGIVFIGGYLMGTADTQKRIDRELLEQQVIFNNQVKQIETDYQSKQKNIIANYLQEISDQKEDYEKQLQQVKQSNLSNTLDIDNMCSVYVSRLHDNKSKTSDRELSSQANRSDVICYRKSELLAKIRASMDIARECDQLATKYNALLKVCKE